MMTMKVRLWPLLVIASLASATSAWSWTGTHGGSCVSCKNRKGDIVSTLLTDSYEASSSFVLDPETSEKDVYDNAIERLRIRPHIRIWVQDFIDHFAGKAVMVNEELPMIFDIGDARRPLGTHCEYRQLAAFDDEELRVNQSLYDAIPTRDRGALILHEAVYHIARLFPEREITDSKWARKVTGQLISYSQVSEDNSALMTSLNRISTNLFRGIYRSGHCRLHVDFDDDRPVLILRKLSKGCEDLGFSRQDIELNIVWQTGEFRAAEGTTLVPGPNSFYLNGLPFNLVVGTW